MNYLGGEESSDLYLIDLLNNFWNKSREYVIKESRLSKATFYRKLSNLKAMGLKETYLIDDVCLGINHFLIIFSMDTSSTNLHKLIEVLKKYSLGPMLIYYTYSPSRKAIIVFSTIDKFTYYIHDTIYSNDSFSVNVGDVFIFFRRFIPLIKYTSSEILDPFTGYNRVCRRGFLDHYDYLIIDAIYRGFSTIKEVSMRYYVPESTIKYHFINHVKKYIVRKIYYLHKSPNYLMQLSVKGNNIFYEILNILFKDNYISSTGLTLQYDAGNNLGYNSFIVEIHSSNISELIAKLTDLYEDNDALLDVRLMPVKKVIV